KARRGEDTLRFGPLKPVGLTDPATGKRPYAVVQLRAENRDKTMYNIVGFQTHLKIPEQKRVFGLIPALKHAVFLRYGVMHRNSFINSPGKLNKYFEVINRPRLYFAGQMTGVEGYIESAASGLMCGINAARGVLSKPPVDFPETTALGALSLHVSKGEASAFQPMNINFGLLPPLPERIRDKKERYLKISERALDALSELLPQIKEDVL
ncbi:MAG: methylenetetrahydrofolate--tRNA-(uracil(54)-C(5))-methyltransferase (FADH(2)-oxidizing) TrmFO, partial [Clostridia bacterium]|nr:methylenetetrahydrofolate--tRNA-(uracil(54)-C(5))-methyltransferase (FADH(2)-oxidizing) TrmFO [Clostridia bacterium]